MTGELENRILDPVFLVSTLAVFFAVWAIVPRLGAVVSALLASLANTIAFMTVVDAMVPRLPSDADTFFALLISALIQCGFAILAIQIWRKLRS
jgi:hypothetical protein